MRGIPRDFRRGTVRPHARLQMGATQALAATTITAISWGSAVQIGEKPFWLPGTPSVITIPEDGLYLFTGSLFSARADIDFWLAQNANAGNRFDEVGFTAAAVGVYGKLAHVFPFAAGYQLQFYAFLGGAANVGGANYAAGGATITKLSDFA